MFRRAIWDTLPEDILKILKLPEQNGGNLKTFKNHEGDLSQKSLKPNVWLLVKKLRNTLYWN